MNASTPLITWASWLAEDPEARERTRRVKSRFVDAPRERPRDPVSAEMLREMGTPEDRIGPVADAEIDNSDHT